MRAVPTRRDSRPDSHAIWCAGSSLEEGIGRAGEVSCDLVTHDYLHIPGGMLDIGEEILAATGNAEVYTPTVEKFCGRSLSGLAIQEFAEKIKINDPLGAQDNNTVATPVTCEYNGTRARATANVRQ